MKKYLINCYFQYYLNDRIEFKDNFALIVSSEDDEPDFTSLIMENLKKLNFDLNDDLECIISFTAQMI